MATTYMQLFDGVEQDKAQKFLDFYDGRGLPYLETYLNSRRTAAVDAGMVPFTRNLTKMIVDKSSMLFKGRAPTIKVYDKGNLTGGDRQVNEAATLAAQKCFEDAGWIEYFNNFDAIVRMTKTAITYVQIDQDEETLEKKFVLTALSQANAAAHFTPGGRLDTLVYYQGLSADSSSQVYSLVKRDEIADLSVPAIKSSENVITAKPASMAEQISNIEANPYGAVTAAVFHDTNIPFRGNWNPVPVDLVQMNHNYNIAITDTNYSSIWAKFPNVVTNMDLGSGTAGSVDTPKSKFPQRNVNTASAGNLIGGPNRVIQVNASSATDVYYEYKAPAPLLAPLQDIMDGYFRSFAEDWSVMVTSDNTGGLGGVASGFALQVREIPNMELREKRARMFEQGFKRLYEVMLKMSDVAGMGLIGDTELFIEFPPPELPVDETAAEAIWSRRIKEGRSSDVEYFIVEQGLTRDEAEAKVVQLAADRALLRAANGGQNPDDSASSAEVII